MVKLAQTSYMKSYFIWIKRNLETDLVHVYVQEEYNSVVYTRKSTLLKFYWNNIKIHCKE